MAYCENCKKEIIENYCSKCGQPATLKRIDGHYIIHEITHVLHFEKGILYTIKQLLIRPGESVRNFVSKDRARLVKPIIFIILTSLSYTLVNHFFHLEDGYIKIDDVNSNTTVLIFKWIQEHYGYSNILMAVFIAFWIKLFFKKYDYNFFEILILLCFVMGMGMLFYTIFGIFLGLTHIDLMQVAGVIGFLYTAWAIGQFFDKSKFSNYFKAFFANILGFITFALAAVLIGNLFDLLF